MNDILPPPASFAEHMADGFASAFPVAGRVVLELASDPDLAAARRLQLHGATVISSNLVSNFALSAAPGIATCAIDARTVQEQLGSNSIDGVFAINLLEHLEDISVALSSIEGALRPSGFAMLHGHPIWTSAHGHHALKYDAEVLFFGDPESDPIPPWAHLYMSQQEMRETLEKRGVPQPKIEAALDWCFQNDLITRTPRNAMLDALRRSSLMITHLQEDAGDYPTQEILARIQNSSWWDPDEDYGIRQISCFFVKS